MLIDVLKIQRRFPRGKRGLKYQKEVEGLEELSRFPRGKRGLKSRAGASSPSTVGRFPRGKRGLKSFKLELYVYLHKSLPPREAWIEMTHIGCRGSPDGSLPPREAWIEMGTSFTIHRGDRVASPAGSVD